MHDYPVGKIPTDKGTANVAFFRLLLLAADIVHWPKQLCLISTYLMTTLGTIRIDFLVLMARLVREHKQTVVKLPRDYHYRTELLAAMRATERMRPPRILRFCK